MNEIKIKLELTVKTEVGDLFEMDLTQAIKNGLVDIQVNNLSMLDGDGDEIVEFDDSMIREVAQMMDDAIKGGTF